jgi:uncharacterized OB-fold protein
MTRSPAVEGFFDPELQALIGSSCTNCGTYAFPARQGLCPNPNCESDTVNLVPLSRRGKIWSYTSASYQPPPPFVPADPFVPFFILAVELEAEGLVVLGQAVSGTTADDLHVGATVEVVTDVLYSQEGEDKLVWKFNVVEDAQ